MAETSYARLRDGSWGVRAQGQLKPGQKVAVKTKKGATKVEIIDKVIWTGNGVTLASVKREEKEQAGDPVTAAGSCICKVPGCCDPVCNCPPNGCGCNGGPVCAQVPF